MQKKSVKSINKIKLKIGLMNLFNYEPIYVFLVVQVKNFSLNLKNIVKIIYFFEVNILFAFV